jgi:hypothetical protein
MSPHQYLYQLMEQEMYADAIRFLAHALPKREAIWWAYVCANQAMDPKPAESAFAALGLARAWVIDPTETHRRAALSVAEAAEFGTPAGCTALAIFFSGGSLAPPQLAEVPPAEHLTANMVANALILSGVFNQPEKSPQKYAAFLQTGLDVASGQEVWPEGAEERLTREEGSADGDARRARR